MARNDDPQGGLDARRAAAQRQCAELAAATDRAWAIASASEQARAATDLARRALRLGIGMVAMSDHPLQAVRLARLLARHYASLPERRRAFHILGFAPLFEHAEAADLVCEVVRSGDSWQRHILFMSSGSEARLERRFPRLGAALARILDEGDASASQRRAAVEALTLGCWPEAVPALRRALRLPLLGVRSVALNLLLDHPSAALGADDLAFLLADAVAHPPCSLSSPGVDDAYTYAEALVESVARLHPAGGWEPLVRIVRGGGAHTGGTRHWLDEDWALRALAAGYPDRALVHADHAMASENEWRRRGAVDAAARLPEAEARPRLLAAATDPAPDVRDHARERGLERFGASFTAGPDQAWLHDLLDGPPSDAFASRLSVLHGASAEARKAMSEFLLGLAPDREALVLLGEALGQASQFILEPARPGLPRHKEAWAHALLERFGPPAFEVLLRLADRYPCGNDSWFPALHTLLRKGLLPEGARERVCAPAARLVASPLWDNDTAPLNLLAAAGPVPKNLWPRLFAIAGARGDGFVTYAAENALVVVEPCPPLDQRLVDEMEAALRTRDFARFEWVGRVALHRGLHDARAVVARALEADDPDAASALAMLGHWMAEAGALPAAWVDDALDRPERPRFAIATHLVGPSLSAAHRELLVRALDSAARDGRAAAEAAWTLVRLSDLSADDARLAAILDRAPPRERALLLGVMDRWDEPHAERALAVLSGPDRRASRELVEDLYLSDAGLALLAAMHERLSDPDLRETIAHMLHLPTDAERYWQDADLDDEDDEDDADDEGEPGTP
ncbi:MAG: hypothetical protein AABZ30_03635 [Myxococcota bacterium]